jgi:hypothetical protein
VRIQGRWNVCGARGVGEAGRTLADDPVFRRKLTDLAIDLTALEYTELRMLAAENAQAAGVEISMEDPQHRISSGSTNSSSRRSSAALQVRRTLAAGETAVGARRHRRGRHLLQHAQNLDLRRLERDSTEILAKAVLGLDRRGPPSAPDLRTWISTSLPNRTCCAKACRATSAIIMIRATPGQPARSEPGWRPQIWRGLGRPRRAGARLPRNSVDWVGVPSSR